MTGSDAEEPIDPATPAAARARLAAVRPDEYARTRNHLGGAVTGLSPYITHGLLDLREVLDPLQHVHSLSSDHKLVFELGWREFFRHCWHHDGDGIFASLHPGPLPDAAYATELPNDIREGRTGFAVVDRAVRQLYATGYLHNHARLWLASYVVHVRKVHWRAGADWLFAHLLDGDLASNHLSWQWVAGTASSKPYLFNAENVRRFAPPSWHIDGTALDVDYATLDAIARDVESVSTPVLGLKGASEPIVGLSSRITAGYGRPDARQVADLDVWVVHPWCLRDPPSNATIVAILDIDFHNRWPWSERRWRWVLDRMNAIAAIRWIGEADSLATALSNARHVSGRNDPHLGLLGSVLGLSTPAPLWSEPGRRLRSFSAWWNCVQ